jgi:hypothetical protein
MAMRRFIAVLAFLLGLLAWHTEVHAQCVTSTYFIGGKMTICTTCCTGGFCNTTCT